MDAATRALVRSRAGDRCEYCHSHRDDEPFAIYHIEHIIAKQHGGGDDLDNLAYACRHCNEHKGPNLAGIDPFDGRITSLFNPRRQRWEDHFADRGPLIFGQSAVGRATVRTLNMNDELRVDLRARLPPRDG